MKRNLSLDMFLAVLAAVPAFGGAVEVPPPVVLLQASFDHGVPAGFEALGGQWQASSGKLTQNPSGGPSLLAFGKPAWTDYTVKVKFRLVGSLDQDAEVGFALNLKDAKNYLMFTVRQRKSGPYAVLRTLLDPGMNLVTDQARLPKDLNLKEWHELKASVHGTDIAASLDGKYTVAYSFVGTPPPYYTHGKTWQADLVKGRAALLTDGVQAEFEALEVTRLAGSVVTPQTARRDQKGRILPRQSYAETMRLFTEWMLSSDEVTDKEKAPAAVRHLPPYLLTNFASSDDKLANVGGEFAMNHALFISGATRYYVFTGDKRPLEMAKILADWNIKNAIPADVALPFLPPSFVKWQKDGSWKAQSWGLEPDKSAYMGISYLKLAAATGDAKYREAAEHIGTTLRKLQGTDGAWPFRVNPQTGETQYGYTCSQLWYVWFYEQLAAVTGDQKWMELRDRAFNWLLENPVKTNVWMGFYGDMASGAKSYDQWVPLEVAMYLLEHRAENAGYVTIAKRILEWVNRNLVVYPGLHTGVPGLLEQTSYKVTLTHHELRLAEMYSKLWQATGDVKAKELAKEIANSVTWAVMSDGKMRQGFWYHATGIPLILEFNDQYARIMAAIPETAPKNENHLLETTGHVEWVRYEKQQVDYRTDCGSQDVLTVAAPPKRIEAGGHALARLTAPGHSAGWFFDATTNRLEIQHREPEVKIEF